MQETNSKIRALRNSAIAAMDTLGIMPTAENYMIWYRDAAGDHPDLSQTLRRLVSRGEAFTEETCKQLYERFFGADKRAEVVDKTCSRLEDSMNSVLAQVASADSSSSSYGDTLSTFQDHLAQTDEIREMSRLVEDVLVETEEMQKSTVELRSALAESTKEIAQLQEHLAKKIHEAETDGLTGIANRRQLEAEFEQAAEEAKESREPLCLLLVDVDHFKQFNDRHGHLIGDQVLKAVAKTLTLCIKGGDVAGRYGGEEFAVILPRTSLQGAMTVGNQIRETVARNRIRIKSSGQDLGKITLSGGCAQCLPGDRFSDVVQRADAALYQAKHAGRNRIQQSNIVANQSEIVGAA